MQALHPHYMEAHSDVMKSHETMSEEESKNMMNKWMTDNRARFDAA
jgi:hypothetical protein